MSWIVVAFMLVAGQGYFWLSEQYGDAAQCDAAAAVIMERLKQDHPDGLQTAAAQCVPVPAGRIPARNEARD